VILSTDYSSREPESIEREACERRDIWGDSIWWARRILGALKQLVVLHQKILNQPLCDLILLGLQLNFVIYNLYFVQVSLVVASNSGPYEVQPRQCPCLRAFKT
jgi:hypothetical protein